MTTAMDEMPMNETPAVQAVRYFNRGNAAWREGRWDDALAGYVAALAADATLAPAALGRARCLVRQGEWMAAREAFAQVLQLEPGNFSAWLEAGHVCRTQGVLEQAAGAYQRAIDIAPERYEAPLAMARLLEQMGHADQGAAAYEHAQQAALAAGGVNGTQALTRLREVHEQMARYRLERGDAAGALPCLDKALAAAAREGASDDVRAGVLTMRGEALLRLGQREAALTALTAASVATGEAALATLAALAFRHNLWQEALAILRKNVDLHPESVTAIWNLAHLLAECWQMDEAEQMLQRAEALGPVPGAQTMRASIAGRLGDADTALALYRDMAQAPGAPANLASSAAMSSLYSDSLSAAEVAELHRSLFQPLGEGARAASSFVRPPLDGRRVRLGIVSADFHHQHPVNIFMQPMLRELDRSRIELFLYFTGVSVDEQTQLARSRVEHWVEVTTLNDAQLARRIDDDGIDVLLDLAGHTGQQRMSLFGKRAAPVQATYLGYPGSTGVPNMDWIFGDEVVTPVGSEGLCSERVARFPGSVFCFAPEEDYPFPSFGNTKSRDNPFLQRPLTFASFNNVPKLTPHTLRLWAAVLAAVPDSRLLLKAPSFGDAAAVQAFSERLSALGVDLARVEFRGPTGLSDMMAEYADVDVALDPVPYNGGTTSLQAMWMGVPVVTLLGTDFVSRMGASFMTAAGLPEWVADSDEAYVAIAVRAAADRKALLKLKAGLRDRLLTRPGWDVAAHTRAFEERVLAMAAGSGA